MTAQMEMPFASPSFAMMSRESGDFLLKTYDNYVDPTKTVLMYEDETKHAVHRKESITMDNGATYEVTSSVAKNRSIDIGIIATTAWLTHELGLNRDRAERATELGIDYTIVSPQQNFNRIGHFGRNVCNVININDYLNIRYDRDTEHLWNDGISRGAMHGFGVAAKAPYIGDKKVIYMDNMVPCFPLGFDPRRDLSQLPALARNELSAMTSFVKLPLNAIATYPRTIAIHPRMVFQQLKEIPALLSGETGEAAHHMPTDTAGYVTNFLGDIMGQGRRWQPILEQYDNLVVDNVKGGGHLSIAAPRAQEKWQRRLEGVHEVIKSDPTIVTLGGTALMNAVHHVSNAFEHRPIAA